MRTLDRILVVVSTVSALTLGGVYVLLRLRPESAWPNCLVAYAPQWTWFAASTVALLVSLRSRSRWLKLANAAVCILVLPVLCGFSTGFPSRGAHSPQDAGARVITWNTHDEYRDAAQIRRALLSYSPDVVCLQEAWDDAFDDLLPDWYEARRPPLRIFTRQPMHSIKRFGLNRPEYRDWLKCTTRVGGRWLVVYNIHILPAEGPQTLSAHEGELSEYLHETVLRREMQFRFIASHVTRALPAVVCGDFNTPPTSRLHDILSCCLADSYAHTRFGLGLSYLLAKEVPAWRIDYVWCGQGLRPLACRLGEAGPSDHRPVIADITIDS